MNDTQEQEKSAFISMRNDYVFTQVMQNTLALKGFIASILNVEPEALGELEFLQRHLKRDGEFEKLGIMDLRVDVKSIGIVIIELQIRSHAYWDNRSIFYSSRSYLNDLKSGSDYSDAKRVINISIVGFNFCTDTDYFYSKFQILETKRHTLYSDKLEFHVIELGKLKTGFLPEDEAIYKWASFINSNSEEERTLLKNDPYIEAARKELEQIAGDPTRFDEYQDRERELMDHIWLTNSARREGLAEGLAEGKTAGLAEGKTAGLAEGQIVGQDRMGKLMKKLLELGKSDQAIAIVDNTSLREQLFKEYDI